MRTALVLKGYSQSKFNCLRNILLIRCKLEAAAVISLQYIIMKSIFFHWLFQFFSPETDEIDAHANWCHCYRHNFLPYSITQRSILIPLYDLFNVLFPLLQTSQISGTKVTYYCKCNILFHLCYTFSLAGCVVTKLRFLQGRTRIVIVNHSKFEYDPRRVILL